MKTPQIINQVGGYQITWIEGKLLVNVSRIHVHTDGRVTGEIEIKCGDLGKQRILLPACQFNFSSEQTRTKFAKQFKEKYADINVDWVEIFDYLGYQIQDIVRSGDTVQDIWMEDDVPPLELIIDPIIRKGVQNIIYGEKGVNKSTLCYLLCLYAMLPEAILPLDLTPPAKPVIPLILDWETDDYIFRYYLSRLKKGMGLPGAMVHYRRCTLPLAQDIEAINKYVQQTNAGLILIDSLGAAAGGELKDSQTALDFNSAIRKINRTTLIIAQTSKGLDNKRSSIYGSTYFSYYSRNIFELCKGEDEGQDTLHVALFHRESNLGRKHSPLGFSITYNDAASSIRIESEPLSASEFAQKISVSNRIFDLLKKGPLEIKDMVSALDVSRSSVDMAIKRLKAKNKLVKLVDGKYGLSI